MYFFCGGGGCKELDALFIERSCEMRWNEKGEKNHFFGPFSIISFPFSSEFRLLVKNFLKVIDEANVRYII